MGGAAGARRCAAAPVEADTARWRWTDAHLDAGPEVRRAHGPPPADVLRRCRHDAGAGDWRQHRHLQLRQHPDAAAAAAEGHRHARLDLQRRSAPRWQPRAAVDTRAAGLPPRAVVLQRDRGIDAVERGADRTRRCAPPRRLARNGELDRRVGHPRRDRPRILTGCRRAWRARGGRAQSPLLGPRIQPRPLRRRADADDRRPPDDDRRRARAGDRDRQPLRDRRLDPLPALAGRAARRADASRQRTAEARRLARAGERGSSAGGATARA